MTGGIGSGKSTVADRLGKLLSAPVLNADDICRQLLEPGCEGYTRFVRSGGERFLDDGGAINRRRLREEMFRNADLKELLESILHPLVFKKIKETAEQTPQSAVIAEVPLLFESGRHQLFDIVISVFSPEELVLERVVERDTVSPEAVLEVIAAQMPPEEKSRRADYVIENGFDLQETEKQLAALAEKLQKRISG